MRQLSSSAAFALELTDNKANTSKRNVTVVLNDLKFLPLGYGVLAKNQTGSTLTNAFYPVNKFLHIHRFAKAGKDMAAHSFLQFRMEWAARQADEVYSGVFFLETTKQKVIHWQTV